MKPSSSDPFLRRAAIGLWLCGVAVLGLVQFFQRAFDEGAFAPSPVAWLWLGGSVVVAGVGLALVMRALMVRAGRR